MENKKLRTVQSYDILIDEEYLNWVHDIKQRFQSAQIKAAVKVNSELLLFNWQLGRDLVERRAEETWGKGIVEQLSLDLQAAFYRNQRIFCSEFMEYEKVVFVLYYC